jgi:hypothetical protein
VHGHREELPEDLHLLMKLAHFTLVKSVELALKISEVHALAPLQVATLGQ